MPDLLALVQHRQVDRLLQQGRATWLQLAIMPVIALPVRQQFAIVVEDLGLGHFFGLAISASASLAAALSSNTGASTV
jgi:hypothetical protein